MSHAKTRRDRCHQEDPGRQRRATGTDPDPFDLDEYVYEALRAGASGFLLKNSTPEQLIEAVRVIARGEALLDPAVTRQVIERFAAIPPPASPSVTRGLDALTPREREVLILVAGGLSNAEIAAELVLGTGTIKTYVANVLMKLSLRDRTQAVVLAYESGLVKPEVEPDRARPPQRAQRGTNPPHLTVSQPDPASPAPNVHSGKCCPPP